MRVFIIEDEALSIERLEKQLSYFPSVQIVGAADSVKSAVRWLSANESPDLILMDIELGDGQCFNIFRQTDISSAVIFITSFDESSMKVFKERQIDYLLKPVKIEDLHKCLDRFSIQTEQNNIPDLDINSLLSALKEQHKPKGIRQRVLVRNGHGLKAVETEEIAYVFAENKHFYLKTWRKETYAIDHNIDEVQTMLDPASFHRLNKMFLVHERSIGNLQSVSNYIKVNLVPSFEKEIIVSKDSMPDFLKRH